MVNCLDEKIDEEGFRLWPNWIIIVTFLVLMALTTISANASMGSAEWSGQEKLDEIGTGIEPVQLGSVNMAQLSRQYEWNKKDSLGSDENSPNPKNQKSIESGSILVTPSEVAISDTILNIDSNPKRYIEGAIHIDSKDFSDGSNRPRPISEISAILGNAGIYRTDSVVIYGEDPSAATYVFLLLDYLGQRRVKLLDGGIEGWTAAGKSTGSAPVVKQKKKYVPSPRTDVIASYEYVKRNDIQVVDARPSKEYSIGSIPGSKNIPYDKVLDGGKIKGESELKDLFTGLNPNKPVAVYSNSGAKASLVWYALELEGFNSRLYAGDNWLANLMRAGGSADKSQSKSAPVPVSSGGSFSPSGGSSGGGAPKCH